MVGRVRQEVAIHSRLKHPSVLELYTFFEDVNYVYLVLELCHNGELQRYLKNNSVILDEEEGKDVVNGNYRMFVSLRFSHLVYNFCSNVPVITLVDFLLYGLLQLEVSS